MVAPAKGEGVGMTLQRLVLDFRTGVLVVRVLHRDQGGANPGTKARTREVTALARSGLTRALEALDAELDRLISRRASQDRRPEPDEQEEIWKASVAAYNARRHEQMRAAWCEYHQDQAARHRAVLEALIASHEAEAARYREQPKGV
jgi:hypothetical protein